MENELKIKELEITKISLLPGQILAVKIFSDDVSQADLGMLRAQMKSLFPNNKIMLFALPTGGKIEMDILDTNPPKVTASSCGPEPTSYCNNCSCGKKEAFESILPSENK